MGGVVDHNTPHPRIRKHQALYEGAVKEPGRMLKKALLAGCSKTFRYKAPETPRSESYSPVRRSDEG